MIARDKIVWKRDEFWGYDVPVEIPGLDMNRFDLNNYYSGDRIQALSQLLKKDRIAWLSQFAGLDRDIIGALKP
jgi:phosphoenolpyruvate carboxykinase (ATP)